MSREEHAAYRPREGESWQSKDKRDNGLTVIFTTPVKNGPTVNLPLRFLTSRRTAALPTTLPAGDRFTG